MARIFIVSSTHVVHEMTFSHLSHCGHRDVLTVQTERCSIDI